MFDVVRIGKLRIVALVFALLVGSLASGAARSTVIYDFSGVFGGGTVAGVLKLSDA
jgi:Na+/citrate or Na+/malate symporter